jgi:hypothetical protein
MCNKNIYFLFIIFFFECAYATSGFNNDNIADIKKVNLIQASKIKSLENQKSLLRNKLKKMQDIESQGNTNQFLPEQYNKIISTNYNSASKIQDKKTIDNGNLSKKTPKSFDSFNHASKVVLEQKYLPKNQIKASISEKNLNQLVENHKGGGGLEQKVNELEQKEKLLMEEKQQKEKELTQKISEFEKLTTEEKQRQEQTILSLQDDHKQNLLAKEKELNNLRLAELTEQEKRFEKLSLEEKERHNEAITNLEETKKKELLAREDELNNLHLAKLLEKQNEFDKLTTEEKERYEQTILSLQDDHKQNLLAKEKELNNLRLAELAEQEKRFEKLTTEEKDKYNKIVTDISIQKKNELWDKEQKLIELEKKAHLLTEENQLRKKELEKINITLEKKEDELIKIQTELQVKENLFAKNLKSLNVHNSAELISQNIALTAENKRLEGLVYGKFKKK